MVNYHHLQNQTPLMHASTHGQLAVVKYLVGNNAHIDKVDKFVSILSFGNFHNAKSQILN